MAFRALEPRTVRWRPAEGVGIEHLDIRPDGDLFVIDSVIVGDRGGRPYGVRYELSCDKDWRTLRLDLRTTDGRELRIKSDGDGFWETSQGLPMAKLDGCIDIDLAGSPFTNTLPIRRIALKPEMGPTAFKMVYVPFDTFEPTVDRQIYTCLEAEHLYRYEAADRSFTADLTVDDDGLVIDYPTLFRRIPS